MTGQLDDGIRRDLGKSAGIRHRIGLGCVGIRSAEVRLVKPRSTDDLADLRVDGGVEEGGARGVEMERIALHPVGAGGAAQGDCRAQAAPPLVLHALQPARGLQRAVPPPGLRAALRVDRRAMPRRPCPSHLSANP